MLGVIFSKQGKKIDTSKIDSISNFPEIKTLKQCQQFLGMLNYLSAFIPHFASRMYPVYCLLRKENQKNFQMTEEAHNAINEVKELLKKETMCYNPDYKEPFYLTVDASQVGVGALLYQIEIYKNNDKGQQEMLKKFGFLPEKNNEDHMLPGVSPGKNTTQVTAFLKDEKIITKCKHSNILNNTLSMDKTMTEKLLLFVPFFITDKSGKGLLTC